MNRKCTCKKAKEINSYEYVKPNRYIDKDSTDHFKFNPSYCPWCGKSLKETFKRKEKTTKKNTKGYNNSKW